MAERAGFTAMLVSIAAASIGVLAAEPVADCGNTEAGSTEALVCGDDGLTMADQRLAEVYAAAATKGGSARAATLAEKEGGWTRGRDGCLSRAEPRACIAEAYRLRIAELQARYRLVEPTGTGRYRCDDRPDEEVVATYFPTDPPSALAERGDDIAVLYQQPAASGARYVGCNESIWEHQGEAMIAWGPGSPERHCAVER